MNKFILRALLILMLLTTTFIKVNAQGSNTTLQPLWGPTGYPKVDYYYLPDIECYYSITSHQFIYLSGGRWIYSATPPSQYRSYDLYSGYKVVINKPRPYLNFSQDQSLYHKFKQWKGDKQPLIRDSKDAAYKRQLKQSPKVKGQDNKGDFGP